MNILIAADYKAPNSGNFIASLIDLGRSIRRHGDSVIFLFPQSKNTLRETDSNWCRWFEREAFPVELFPLEGSEEDVLHNLLGLVDRYSIDVLHLHFGIFHRLMLKYRYKFKGKKIIIHDHMDFPAGHKNDLRSSIRNLVTCSLYNLYDIGYVAIAFQKYNYFRNKIRKCWYLPNALSYERNIPESKSREDCRRSMGLLPSDKVCLFLGWSLDVKGLDIAIKAVNEYRKTSPDLLLAIVGFGTAPSPSASQYIEARTEISATSPWIQYWISTEDMYSYHRAADVYLSASRTESFSYGLLESISQNTPVVVSDIVGTRWSWEYSKCFHYPVEDYHACCKALEQALKVGHSESNAHDIVRKYDIRDWCEQVIAIYKA